MNLNDLKNLFGLHEKSFVPNVGIGTNNSGSLLEVYGGGGDMISLNATSGGFVSMVFEESGSARGWVGYDTSANQTYLESATGENGIAFMTSGAYKMVLDSSGRVGVGNTSPNVGAIMELNGTGNLSSLLLPRGTTAQRAATPANGMIRYNTATSKFEVYEVQWKNMVGGGDFMANGSVPMTGQFLSIAGTANAPGFAISGDPDTGIWSNGANRLAISTGGTGRVFVDTVGNVGIGTATPGTTLDIITNTNASTMVSIDNGNAGAAANAGFHAGTNAGSFDFMMYSIAGGNLAQFQTGAPTLEFKNYNGSGIILFNTNNVERIRIDNLGRVGIGTNSPTAGALLDLNGTGNLTSLLIPRGTTSERAAVPANGMIRYNTNTAKFEVYETQWKDMVGGGGSPGGSSTHVQYNNGSGFAGSGNFTWNNGTSALGVTGSISAITTRTDTGGGWVDPNLYEVTANPGGASTSDFHGISGKFRTLGSNTINTGTGVFGWTQSNGTGAITEMRNFYGYADVTNANVSNINGFKADMNINASRTVNTWTGLEVNTGTNNGTLNTSYGVRIRNQLGTTAWGVYQDDITDNNYFGGKVGIGTNVVSDGAALNVVGTGVNFSSILVPRDTTANRPTGVNGMLRYNSNSNQFEGFGAGGWAPIVRARSFSGTSGAIDWSTAAAQSTSFNCATDITFANLVDGGSYTLSVTDGGTTQCNFSTTTTGADAATVNYRFNPTNGPRTTTSHTVYSIQRIGTTVYISWISGF